MGRRLDRTVTFLEAATSKSPTGNKTKTGWNELFPVAASYQALSDGERWRAGAVEQKAEARFTVRYSARAAAILGANRLRFEGADWEITGSKEIGRRRWIEITAWKIR
ncbi:head-tail adaptor protein [Phaeobacter gallaeciensis]|uniref:head-tail adaptor protein n=1 Tax=Phaeobacter gallaeciensis TaxID=60890 RepID=UPI00237F1C65|nr:head-tail adaptor protein [Phaeobacter gallaeciensis]MDE4192431.1 head-tail adaptor protein [Phaeobacter gallaeciensis]MDE4201751.1 head-tail adaptor protein [Phaeobacter gallaeciensis]MDE4205255.1 head-tail adaptor protein [Phaeobacter gallaeciensis]MDE4209394.1 head-tail adaptor protein [Phaeobacter gallaeciensis]MDE4217554.1 head-tail adaptor protein [Phaeobacter gallaeciensis]